MPAQRKKKFGRKVDLPSFGFGLLMAGALSAYGQSAQQSTESIQDVDRAKKIDDSASVMGFRLRTCHKADCEGAVSRTEGKQGTAVRYDLVTPGSPTTCTTPW